MWAFVFLKCLAVTSYSVDTSFRIMFMIVIGGMGSIMGSYIGTAFVLLIPILLNIVPSALSLPISTGAATRLEQTIFGLLIIYFVVAEPQGIIRILRLIHRKFVSWPLTLSP